MSVPVPGRHSAEVMELHSRSSEERSPLTTKNTNILLFKSFNSDRLRWYKYMSVAPSQEAHANDHHTYVYDIMASV